MFLTLKIEHFLVHLTILQCGLGLSEYNIWEQMRPVSPLKNMVQKNTLKMQTYFLSSNSLVAVVALVGRATGGCSEDSVIGVNIG